MRSIPIRTSTGASAMAPCWRPSSSWCSSLFNNTETAHTRVKMKEDPERGPPSSYLVDFLRWSRESDSFPLRGCYRCSLVLASGGEIHTRRSRSARACERCHEVNGTVGQGEAV